VGKQSALVGGAPQLLGDACSIGVRCTHVPVLCHLLAPSRIAACGSVTRVRADGRLTKGWALPSDRVKESRSRSSRDGFGQLATLPLRDTTSHRTTLVIPVRK
jgi:hypothetical protein